MTEEILIDGKPFEYTPVHLYYGRKQLDSEVARENLFLLNEVLASTNIVYGLIFGTLLGAIREGQFIAHDEDIDLYVLDEYKSDVIRLLPELKEKGLKLVRVNNDELSLMRNDEYIDIYFFKQSKKFFSRRKRVHNENYSIRANLLEETMQFTFLNMIVPVPSNPEYLLKKIYGGNWRTPIQGRPALPNSLVSRVKRQLYLLKKWIS